MITFTNRNKLIAEFMDYPDLGTEGDFSYLKYHKSWDWLMPVVDKCTQIGYRDQDFDSEIYGTWEGLFDDASMFLGNHIEEVYWSVVHFIEWYAEYKREEAQEYPLTPKESYPVTKNK